MLRQRDLTGSTIVEVEFYGAMELAHRVNLATFSYLVNTGVLDVFCDSCTGAMEMLSDSGTGGMEVFCDSGTGVNTGRKKTVSLSDTLTYPSTVIRHVALLRP